MAANQSALLHLIGQSSLHSDRATHDAFANLEWPEDATLVTAVCGYLPIELPPAEPIPTVLPTAARPATRLLHGQSPLGRAAHIVADDLEPAAAKSARLLQLICDERRMTSLERRVPSSTSWKDLKREVPDVPSTRPVPAYPQGRTRNTEPPLARRLL